MSRGSSEQPIFFDGKVQNVFGEKVEMALADGRSASGKMVGDVATGDDVNLSVRPEQIYLTREIAGANSVPVTVQNRIFLGEHTEYLVRHAGSPGRS